MLVLSSKTFAYKFIDNLNGKLTKTCLNSMTSFLKSIIPKSQVSTVKKYSSTFSSEDTNRRVPICEDDFKVLKHSKPCQPENPYHLKVSILGEPNAGKSTLTNSLVKWKVCAVSKKVHTTRKKSAAVLVHENKQVVFLDTPGFVTAEMSKRHSLEPSFVMDPLRSIREADLIAVIIDISNKYTNNRICLDILQVLDEFRKKTVLVLNKIDAMKSKERMLHLIKILTDGAFSESYKFESEKKKVNELTLEDLSDLTKKYSNFDDSEPLENIQQKRGWPFFYKVFMVSALKNNGIDDLRDYLLSETLPGEWSFNDHIVTDQHPHEIALMTVREKLLEYLPQEIPYALKLKISSWEILSTGCPKISIKIQCSNTRHKRFVIGPEGKHIAACVERTRHALRESFRKDVVLNIGVN